MKIDKSADIQINPKDRAIINGAIKVFIKKGFDNATIDEIAKEAGVGKGTIYRHIGNKNKLENFVIKQVGRLMFEKIKKKAGKRHNPLLQFKEIINTMCDFFEDNLEIAMLFYSRVLFNPRKINLTTNWPPITGLKTEALAQNILKKAKDEGRIKNVDINVFLRGFTYYCNPFYYHFLKEKMDLTKSEITTWIIDSVLNGIVNKK